MGIRTDKSLRQDLIFVTLLVLVVALFTSRVLLSAGMISLLVLTLVHRDFLKQLKLYFSNPLLIGMSLLFLIPVLTWFWSEDKTSWLRWARIKLPLFLLPLAFAGNWQLSKKQWRWLAIGFLLMTLGGCIWSLGQYIQDIRAIHEGYLRAVIIATPLENDHVRFSLIVCLAFIAAVLLIKNTESKYGRVLLLFSALFFAVYLHILSARTGLLGLYVFLLIGFFYLIFTVRKSSWLWAICFAILAMPLAAWFFLPTFQNRIRYIIYDFSFIRNETYLPGANDGNRLISLRAGWSILKENPMGVGSGDVVNETWAWYYKHIPQMLETDKLYPASEWLLYGDAAGWPGIILFTIVMLIPFFMKERSHRFFWISLNLIMALSFLFDIGLETQFGVFIYAFGILCGWKAGEIQNSKIKIHK
jgi:hypothetical protein